MARDLLSIDYTKNTQLSTLESQILTQYQLLATKLHSLSDEIRRLHTTNASAVAPKAPHASAAPASSDIDGAAVQLAETLRGLELKIGLVYTLFRGAVYSLIVEAEGREQDKSSPQYSHADVESSKHRDPYQHQYEDAGRDDPDLPLSDYDV